MKNGTTNDYWRVTVFGKQYIVANLQFSDFQELIQELHFPSTIETREVLKGKVFAAYEIYIVDEDTVRLRTVARASKHDLCRNVHDFIDLLKMEKEQKRHPIYTPADPVESIS